MAGGRAADRAAAATLSGLDLCDHKLEVVKLAHMFLPWSSCATSWADAGSTFNLDPVSVSMNITLCPGSIFVTVNWKKFKLGTDIPTIT